MSGGHGPTLVLLHGYPQTWYEWREILPELAKHYTVIAPDLPGAGKSDAPAGGYDKKTMAADLHGAAGHSSATTDDIRLVGHDIGTMVAYAYAAAYPRDVTKLVLSEAPIPDPSLYTFPVPHRRTGPGVWNFGYFALTNGLPEQHRQRPRRAVGGQVHRLDLEVQKNAVGADDRSRVRRLPAGSTRTWRRASNGSATFPRTSPTTRSTSKTKLTMPVLAIGADGSLGNFVPPRSAGTRRTSPASSSPTPATGSTRSTPRR